MTEFGILDSILMLLAIAVSVSIIFRQLQLPVILGYLLVGVAVGPFALGWVPEENIGKVAEFGVVFLMFAVGLEFSIKQLVGLRYAVFVVGSLHVLCTTSIVMTVGIMLKMNISTALILGGIVSMSSTALVIKQLSDQLEIAAQHGSNALGILLFEDLAVIPFLILIPSLSLLETGNHLEIAKNLAWALTKGVIAMALILGIGRWLLRPLFRIIAKTRVIELFTLTVLLVTLGSAWLTHYLGLSLALGAFLAGIMLSETEFRYQIEIEIRPFRDVLLALFFISIGMLLNLSHWPQTWPWILLLLFAIVIGKGTVITTLNWLLGYDFITSLRTGIVMAQGGEFGFALLSLAFAYKVIPPDYGQVILSALIVSIALAPILIRWNRNIPRRLFPKTVTYDLVQIRRNLRYSIERLRKPVIICGYGRVGQNVARIMEKAEIDYLALDIDPTIIKTAQTAGDSVIFGDATHPAILKATKLNRACAVVVTFANLNSMNRILDIIRTENPTIPIIVRCADDSSFEELKSHGASAIVVESYEASLVLSYNVLKHVNLDPAHAAQIIQNARGHHYDLLRHVFPGEISDDAAHVVTTPTPQLRPLVIAPKAYAVGCTLGELALNQVNVRVISVTQGSNAHIKPKPELTLHAGDIIVLYGTPENIELAERLMLGGEQPSP